MKPHCSWRALVAAIITLCALAPAPALARPGSQPEPIFVLQGFDIDCTVLASDAGAVGPKPLAQAYVNASGARMDAAYKWNVQPLPDAWFTGFTTAEGYTFCTQSTQTIGRRLYDKIKRKIAEWNASLPAGYDPVTKVDIVGFSYGSTVARSCIANTGRGNPANETPGCAALVDDWVGIVPPSHGTRTPWTIGCPLAPQPLCMATNPGGDFLLKLNERFNGTVADQIGAGDETPQVPGTTPIEYTTMWAGNDGLINPAGSAALWGAANLRLEAGAPTDATPPTQLTHLNATNPGLCPGSPDFATSGVWEWIAWELLDVGTHEPVSEEFPRAFPTAVAPSRALNCRSAPPGLTPPVGTSVGTTPVATPSGS